MAISPSTTFSALLGAILIRFVVKYALTSRKATVPYPPGPKPRFLIGNALDIPFQNASKIYRQWSNDFNSSIMHLYALGQRIVVLNAVEDVVELFENRARIYSDRPVFPVRDMIGWGYNLGLLNYGDFWRAHRKVCQQNFKVDAVHKYRPIQTRKVHEMLLALLDTPDAFVDHNKLMSIGITVKSMYSYETKTLDDPLIKAADKSVELGNKMIAPGGSFINIFPILRYVPWTWSQRTAKGAREATEEMKKIPLDALMKSIADGTATPCLVGEFMEKKHNQSALDIEEDVVLNVANTVYGSASDTTISATTSLFYYLATNPEVQTKAHAEIDKVLGCPPRLPTHDDKASLPYIYAIYCEILRCCPPLSMAGPHRTTEDDWYKGYHIPRGTMVFSNICLPDPMKFNPGRYLDADGQLNDLKLHSYGFGRRACPSRHFASATLWFTIASLLACFNLRQKKDQYGKEIEIDDEIKEDRFLREYQHRLLRQYA
ncbi:cytochrome P450 [Panaeolus papilionaceus]|nr:cytochrome P450 [Panaeolus papilionaceus]